MPPQQQGWQQPGYGQQPGWTPSAPKSQSASSSRPFLVLLLFILLIGMGVLAYFKTPLGSTINSIIGIGGGGNTDSTVNDTTLPVITFPANPTVSVTSASVFWHTDEFSSTQVEYGISATYGTLQPPTPQDDPSTGESLGVIDHSVVLTGLQPDTTYHYKVKSKDKAGNIAISGDKTFTTLASEPTE